VSAYLEGTTAITCLEDLLAALAEVGYTKDKVEVHDKPVNLVGYHGDTRKDLAHVIVRRVHVGSASNDIGFLKEGETYKAIVSQYDTGYLITKHKCPGGFINEISTRAAICAAERKAQKKGFKTTRKQDGRKITLLMEKN